MKKTILAVTALVLVSAQAMAGSVETMDKAYMAPTANYTMQSSIKTLRSEPTSSRDAAYQQGYDIMNNLHGKSPTELRNILKLSLKGLDTKSVMIEDKEVTVKEFSKKPNVFEYQALVNVKYHYRQYQSHN
jgi:hypothetical protein